MITFKKPDIVTVKNLKTLWTAIQLKSRLDQRCGKFQDRLRKELVSEIILFLHNVRNPPRFNLSRADC